MNDKQQYTEERASNDFVRRSAFVTSKALRILGSANNEMADWRCSS